MSFCKALFLLCSAKTDEAKSDKLSFEVEAEVVAAVWEVDMVVAGVEVLVAFACDEGDANEVVELVDLLLTWAKFCKTDEAALESLEAEAIGGATKAVAVEVGLAVAEAAPNVS